MTKMLIAITSFILGALVTATGSFMIWQQTNPSQSKVWITDSEMKLNDGIVIPREVELIQERWMPEGFVTLKLYVNVEGDALKKFKQRTEPHPCVHIQPSFARCKLGHWSQIKGLKVGTKQKFTLLANLRV